MSRLLRLGSRRSALARVQAHQVGAQLQRIDPAVRIEYHFIEASGDRSSEPDAGLITARGGFSEDLGVMLEQGDIDLAVHSWKDLPYRERDRTFVAATLPRADARDVLLVRRDSLASAVTRGLRILSSSARRRHHLEEFLDWALPVKPVDISFSPVRGDIGTRLRKLLRGDGDALVIAKAALDRLIETPPDEIADTANDSQSIVRQAMSECRAMVLPMLYCPAAPAQGALAVEVPVGTPQLDLWRELNHADTFDLVHTERSIARRYGDDEPLGVTRLRFDFGDVQFIRGSWSDEPAQRARLYRFGTALPRPKDPGAVWCGEPPESAVRTRLATVSTPTHFAADTGLLIARAEALPINSAVDERTIVWTAGLTTWRKLAARGVWVTGSDESLGETGASAIRAWYRGTSRWLKLTHEDGFLSERAQLLPTYRSLRRQTVTDVGRYSHFFWQSGTQLREYLHAFPSLANAWHGCGPGNTYRIARDLLGPERVRPFLNAPQFRDELLA
jgi:hydroxymethylbilane synthase